MAGAAETVRETQAGGVSQFRGINSVLSFKFRLIYNRTWHTGLAFSEADVTNYHHVYDANLHLIIGLSIYLPIHFFFQF